MLHITWMNKLEFIQKIKTVEEIWYYFIKKMHEFAIERIISGDWDKFSEDYGPDLDNKSFMSKEDLFEIRIRSALSGTLYKEIRQDDWLKKNLLGIYDRDNKTITWRSLMIR